MVKLKLADVASRRSKTSQPRKKYTKEASEGAIVASLFRFFSCLYLHCIPIQILTFTLFRNVI